MPASHLLSAPAALFGWPMGALSVRGDDVYALIGLVSGLVLLVLWALAENLRLTRRRAWTATFSPADAPSPAQVQALGQPPAAVPATPDAPDAPDMAPVPARTEWLLDDNTLLRTGAVKRPSIRREPARPLVTNIATVAQTAATPPAPSSSPAMKASRPLKIAMMGSRGIPADDGEIEREVEQLAVHLVERGHSVTVYCTRQITWPQQTYKGVHLAKLPVRADKRRAYTLRSILHGEFRDYQVVYLRGADTGAFSILLRLAGKPTVIDVGSTVGGADGSGGSTNRQSDHTAKMTARRATCVVSGSQAVQRYYQTRFNTPVVVLPRASGDTIADYYEALFSQMAPGT